MSYEGFIFNKERLIDIEKGYEKARGLIHHASIKPEDFLNKYGKDEIEKDNKYVEKKGVRGLL